MRIVGSAYRRSRVLIAIEALDRVELTALNPSRRRVLVTDENGFTELPAWIDGSGGRPSSRSRASCWPPPGPTAPATATRWTSTS